MLYIKLYYSPTYYDLCYLLRFVDSLLQWDTYYHLLVTCRSVLALLFGFKSITNSLFYLQRCSFPTASVVSLASNVFSTCSLRRQTSTSISAYLNWYSSWLITNSSQASSQFSTNFQLIRQLFHVSLFVVLSHFCFHGTWFKRTIEFSHGILTYLLPRKAARRLEALFCISVLRSYSLVTIVKGFAMCCGYSILLGTFAFELKL